MEQLTLFEPTETPQATEARRRLGPLVMPPHWPRATCRLRSEHRVVLSGVPGAVEREGVLYVPPSRFEKAMTWLADRSEDARAAEDDATVIGCMMLFTKLNASFNARAA